MIKRSSVLIFACCLVACNNADSEYTNNKYFQYYISTIHINNPRAVYFLGSSCPYDSPMSGFVCPDSAVKYCADSGWIDRDDVFLLNSRWYNDEKYIEKAYGKWIYKLKPWDVGYGTKETEYFNDTISIGSFYFDKDLSFVLSMHTTKYWTWDAHSPGGDLVDTATFSNTYRLAVRPNYSIWQTLRIRKFHKQNTDER